MSLFRKRDLAIVIVVAISIYVSLFETPSIRFSLEPAWFIDQRKLDEFEDLNLGILPPVVTDLNGDGSNELILITSDLQLKIFNSDVPKSENNDIYHPEEVANAYLNSISDLTMGRVMPIAIKTGYVTPYEQNYARSQVIVIVREDWSVACYDSTLNKLWDKQTNAISKDMFKYYKIHDVTIHISPLMIENGSNGGLIVVGASMISRNDIENEVKLEQGIDMKEDPEHEHPEMDHKSILEHFTIYALNSNDGHEIWHHDGAEVRSEQYSKSLPQHAYSLDIQDLMAKTHHAPGINDWTFFRQSLIDELPHYWQGPEDTSLRIAHFVRRHVGAGVGQQVIKKNPKNNKNNKKALHKDIASSKGRNGKTMLGLAEILLMSADGNTVSNTASLPHNAAEHTINPNVIVAHTKNGIEVISLRSGIPITSLALNKEKAYGDIDGDGVVDSIVILDSPQSVTKHESEYDIQNAYSHDQNPLTHCMIVVLSGLPPISQLFNGSICLERPSLHDPIVMSGRRHNQQQGHHHHHTRHEQLPSIIGYAPPLVLNKFNADTMKESNEKDLIFAVHTGVITSYSGKGQYNWQIHDGPTWSIDHKPPVPVSIVAIDSDALRASELGTHNSDFSNILIVGETSLQMISRDGEILTSAELPKVPISKPILADFDNDGVTDVIIVTKEALLGYHLHVFQSSKGVLIALVLLTLIAVVVFIANIQNVNLDEINNSGQRLNANVKTKKSAFKIIRSTDDSHLD